MLKSLTDLRSVADYLKRIGGEERSLRTAVVKEKSGAYWTDVAVIRFDKTGAVNAPAAYAPTESEQALILSEFSTAQFPELKTSIQLRNLPPSIQDARPEDIFKFVNELGEIVMLQIRKERKGEKSYIPYTYWSDNQWRAVEPDGHLPLWGIDQLKENDVVFIHEGAKAARAMRDMVEAKTPEAKRLLNTHPWGEELKHAAHIGWIGGALSPHRTDWSVLGKLGVKRVYIVSDNDAPGIAAVPSISYQLRCPTFHVQFTNEWPVSFDLADPFPKTMFSKIGEDSYYTGPSFRSCVHPATWATDQIPNPRGKPTTVLRDSFKAMWAYAEEQDVYVCVEMPEIVRTETILNKMMSAFSHSSQTISILQRHYSGRSTKLCYRPDVAGRMVTEKNSSAINLHTPTMIKSKRGDIKPFLDFIDYLLPNREERDTLLDWCTTLIAHPEIRMDYGLLMVSETQGIGKTTLGSKILGPLVGTQNISFPSEKMITNSDFNEWLANKRLIIVNEIYSGHSWKAYNALKSIITDETVDVNIKFMRPYTIENWSHTYACSNSLRALKMESSDRRWFYPEITERPWPKEKFLAFNQWLMGGGLSIIKAWAEDRKTWVKRGERAPMTGRKKELIEGSRTDGQIEAVRLAETINMMEEPVAVAMKDIVSFVRGSVQGKVYDSDLELRKAMKEAGCIVAPARVKLFGMMQYVILNNSRKWEEWIANDDDLGGKIKLYSKKPDSLISSEM